MGFKDCYDVIVIGGGHAGCEAGLASARLGCRTLLLTINLDAVALMPCNCSIGGPGKGHLVREIDALGGEMAKNIDKTYTHIRMLNTSKGPAVQVPRAQADKRLYQLEMKYTLEEQENLDVKQGVVEEILVENSEVRGVVTNTGMVYAGKVVIVATGTFLNGLVHIGEVRFPAGRIGEFPAIKLSDSLRKLGLELGRLNTDTTARVNKRSIDFSKCMRQESEEGLFFSYQAPQKRKRDEYIPCWITYTTERTREIIMANLQRAAFYSGQVKSIGPRYCPSIEDKMVRFPEKACHQVILEQEGFDTDEIYVQGMFTSLAEEVQVEMLRSIPGLEEVELMRPGYAIEYDFVYPTQIKPSLETKTISGLFLAGQINGTSGYEEAAAQGLIAGINAGLKLRGKEPLVLSRSEAYIGVMIDDLVTKGTEEPYRILTSRAEYRLLLRQDNAHLRLMDKGYKVGLVGGEQYRWFCGQREMIEKELDRLKNTVVRPSKEVGDKLKALGSEPTNKVISLAELLRRPEISYKDLCNFDGQVGGVPEELGEQVAIEVKYEGYIRRQLQQVENFKKLEGQRIPEDMDYSKVVGLSAEGREKLARIRPISIGQASRIAGMKPADISVLLVYLKSLKG